MELGDDQSRLEMIETRRKLVCSFCPPHRRENATRWVRHGVKKPRYKDKRRK